MLIPKPLPIKSRLMIAAAFIGWLMVPACTVDVKDHDANGNDKVDITTPIGGIHVNEDVDVRDTGLTVYPGARKKPKTGNDEKGANVNISTGFFAVRVAAIEFESDDAPSKVVAFYQDQLKKFGSVVECHTTSHGDDLNVTAGDKNSHLPVACKGNNQGNVVELKVGTEDHQHLVSIEPQNKGTDFALVFIETRGKEGTI